MGGDLTKAPKGKSPCFLVAALKDSMSGYLDRIQIIKGWVGKDGKEQERVYDVVVSDNRKIGDPELITVWTNPDFDPSQRAFYYVRVIEIPTPRWTAYEAMRFNIKLPKDVKMITRERAYTSPIWYTPNNNLNNWLHESLFHFFLTGVDYF